MKKTLMLLVAAICLSCSGQWVITNYVYTVSNITIFTQNEITQNVNRAYNYYSTNFTVNVETNLYIDTMIGTNIATNVENWVINDYSTNFVENITTNIYIDTVVGTNIATNVVNITTNMYIDTVIGTNITTHVQRISYYDYSTNFVINITTNTYIGTVIGTNVVYDIHTTNQESYVALSNIERNVRNNALLSLRYSREAAGYSDSAYSSYLMGQSVVSNAMLFAYIAIESVNRLGNTNDTYIATNSTVYTDIYGTEYSNMSNLTINNVNGDLIAIANRQYDYIGGGGGRQNHYSTSYVIRIGGSSSSSSAKVTYNISHASEGIDGMRIIYLPDQYRFPSPWNNLAPVCLYWNCDNLVLINKGLDNDTFMTNVISGLSSRPYNTPWPNGMYSSYGDSASGWVDMKGWKYNGYFPQLKTKFDLTPTTDIPCIMISRFPSLSDWKIMWEITNLTGYQFFR